MKTYKVIYHWLPNSHETYLFVCQAENKDHAKEQCLNAYPDCKVLKIISE